MDDVKALTEILNKRFPSNVWDDSAMHTAKRFLSFLDEYKPKEKPSFEFTTFPYKGSGQIVAVANIEYSSICAHHLLPFYGTCDIAYIPSNVIVGLSKIPRLVDFEARRPHTQETLSDNIASFLKSHLNALGSAAIVRASHTCMSCRGVRKVGATMITSTMKGVFLTNPAARQELFQMLELQKP